MTKAEQQKLVELEMAEAPKSFVEGDYFRGMCEIAAAAHTNTPLFIPQETEGIFNSLYFRRIFARKQLEDGSWMVGNIAITNNRYLYTYDRVSKTYTSKKEDNYNKFVELVKSISDNKDYKVFSTVNTVAKESNDLEAILG
jgi:hypothetical protein